MSLKSSVKPDMKNRKLLHVLCQVHSCCLCYQRQEHVKSQANTFAPALYPVGNLNALCKYRTKKLVRIQVNKSNPKFTFRVVYLKYPITSTHRGHNTTQLHRRRNAEFLKLWPQKRWFPLNILVQDGESQSSGCCQDLGLIFITSWERVNVGVVK